MEKINQKRKGELLIIDLSVPRNIPGDCADIENVKLINVDDLKDAVNHNYKKRRSQIVKAEKFIEDFLTDFDDWTNSRQLRPSILSIKKQRFGKVKGEAHVDGKLVCAGELMFSLVD